MKGLGLASTAIGSPTEGVGAVTGLASTGGLLFRNCGNFKFHVKRKPIQKMQHVSNSYKFDV